MHLGCGARRFRLTPLDKPQYSARARAKFTVAYRLQVTQDGERSEQHTGGAPASTVVYKSVS